MQGKQAKMLSLTQERAILGYLATTRYPHRDRVMFLLSIKAGLRAKEMAHSSWVATRRGLRKPVSSSPPFKTGLAAFTAPGLTPAILLRGLMAPRSVPSHFPHSTGHSPWSACAFARDLCSGLFES